MFGKSEGQDDSAGSKAYRDAEAAYLDYFRDVQAAWLDTQERMRALHMDYERAALRAPDAQELSVAVNEARLRYTDNLGELDPVNGYIAAFDKYKAATQKALAEAAVEHLDYATLAAIGMAMATVANHACAVTGGIATQSRAANAAE